MELGGAGARAKRPLEQAGSALLEGYERNRLPRQEKPDEMAELWLVSDQSERIGIALLAQPRLERVRLGFGRKVGENDRFEAVKGARKQLGRLSRARKRARGQSIELGHERGQPARDPLH